MTGPMSLKGIVLTMAVLTVATPRDTLAQRHVADSSITPSLLVGALSIPSSARYTPTDSVFARRFTRAEIQYNRTSTADMSSMVVVGVRSDDVTLDSLNWNASVFGVRAGLARSGTGNDDLTGCRPWSCTSADAPWDTWRAAARTWARKSWRDGAGWERAPHAARWRSASRSSSSGDAVRSQRRSPSFRPWPGGVCDSDRVRTSAQATGAALTASSSPWDEPASCSERASRSR